MRVVRYIAPGGRGAAVGIVEGDSIAEVAGSGGSLGALLLLDHAGLERVASTAIVHHGLSDVRLLPAVDGSSKILLLAANYYPTDVEIKSVDEFETPEFFSKPSTSLLAHDETVPANSLVVNKVEEIELGVVIGKPGKNISADDAFDHIFGYTVVNDFSGRDLDFSPNRASPDRKKWFDWLNGKWLDGFCPVGPWIVESSEVDPTNLGLKTVVNGEVRIDSNTNRMIHNIPTQIAYISSLCTLMPGDVISTGVALAESDADEIYLKSGDVIEGTVEGIGTLRNTVG